MFSRTPYRRFLFSLILAVSPRLMAAESMATKADDPGIVLPPQLPELTDTGALGRFHADAQSLARQLLIHPNALTPDQTIFLQMLLGDNRAAIEAIQKKRQTEPRGATPDPVLAAAQLLAKARSASPENALSIYGELFAGQLQQADPVAAHALGNIVTYSLERDVSYINWLIGRVGSEPLLLDGLGKTDPQRLGFLSRLLQVYGKYRALAVVLEESRRLIGQDRERRYHIETDAFIRTPDGIRLSAMVVKRRDLVESTPAILSATIYSEPEGNLQRAIEAAAHGYVGVVSDSRGKRLGTGTITPYEKESEDVFAVIDWISKQSWNDGRVAMYGGSYLGYTQWAATRNRHPALKTIVPSVAAMPGQGLPMENNVFLTANYAWTSFVTNGPLNDDAAYSEKDWSEVNREWFESGRPYREFDQVAGKPNPWLQKWLDHPAFDDYWQSMIPSSEDYAALDIPVLTITGYFDDGQISAIQFLKDHYRANPDAEHYLIIGPYDHFSSQTSSEATLRGYTLDPVSRIDVPAITFAWFDHVLKGADRPQIIQDRINYQLMGDNSWRHAASLAALDQNQARWYLDTETKSGQQPLTTTVPDVESSTTLTVDFSDRSRHHNQHYYPYPIIRDALEADTGLSYVSDPFDQEMELSGILSGELRLRINKNDLDIGLVLFEITESGQFFHLGYALGRASYARDPAHRQLLRPGEIESIPVPRARMVSKRIGAGSRLLLLADVNFNPFAQVNYGTGRDVSEESIADADEPLTVEWMNSSYISLPLRSISKPGSE